LAFSKTMIFHQDSKDPYINFLKDDFLIRPPEQVMSRDRSQPNIDIAKLTEFDDQMLNRFDILNDAHGILSDIDSSTLDSLETGLITKDLSEISGAHSRQEPGR
jgi:hypothetical protein